MKGVFRSLAFITAAIAAATSPAASAPSNNKDAAAIVHEINRSSAPTGIRNNFSGQFSGSGERAGLYKNQRQHRKMCKQNPWMYKSKKHRSKN